MRPDRQVLRPIRQLSDQIDTLTGARSVTARIFTRHWTL
jgi:hypothetical protein